MTSEHHAESAKPLLEWFEEHRREMPWRGEVTPYRVWVSEVMLQQTQVAVVIPYFQRFMERFPTIEALSQGSEEEVIKLWEGLGYYSRARSLHRGAKWVVEQYGGKLPKERADLLNIPGIGPYTMGAIRSFAFHAKEPAVDGNVARVISRLFGIEEEVSSEAGKRVIQQRVLEVLPEAQPWIVMEALIELGALVCTKRPKCDLCPLKERCTAHRMGRELELPKKKQGPRIQHLNRFVPIIQVGKYYLLRKEIEKKIMQGLWQFPYFDGKDNREEVIKNKLNLSCQYVEELPKQTQTFTRYKVTLFPSLWQCKEKTTVEGFSWKHQDELKELVFCAGHRKIARGIARLSHASFTY